MIDYIRDYWRKIETGEIIVGDWTRKGYKYIIDGLENGSFFYSEKKAAKAITFIENFVHHHEGELAPGLIRLELWQKAFVSALFGIVDGDGNRQFRESLLVIGRKNGKTLLAAAVAAYMTYMDGEEGAQTYFCAPKLLQSGACFKAFWRSILREPELKAISRKSRNEVTIARSGSTAMPLAYDPERSDSLNISCCICDEVAAWKGESGKRFYEVLTSSTGARRQPLILSISTAGYVDAGTYDELMGRATRILKGDSSEKRLLPILYMIDDPEKWNDLTELKKSNPNLGVSVTEQYLLDQIAIAENSLSKKAEFLVKHCNIKQNASVALLDYYDVEKAGGDPLHLEDFKNHYCLVGIDLSQTTDLSAACAVIEVEGEFYIFCQFYLPAGKLDDATARDGLPYREYIKRGLLTLSGDNFIDYHDISDWVTGLIRKYKVYPLMVGYDRYSAQYLITDLESKKIRCDDVFQGNQLYPIIKYYEGLIKDGKIHIGDNDLLKIHMLNAGLKMDNEQNRGRLVKIRPEEHIDGFAAVIDAFTVRSKWWPQYGNQLQNKKKG